MRMRDSQSNRRVQTEVDVVAVKEVKEGEAQGSEEVQGVDRNEMTFAIIATRQVIGK